jgi:hypothetical protein
MFVVQLVIAVMAQVPTPAGNAQRFDNLVREDFFAGVSGDEARLQKVLDVCDAALARDPRDAQALVWHGSALVVRAGRQFEKGDPANGGATFERGMKEMDDALGLAPDNPGVLIPRAAVLFEATRPMPPQMARPLLESAVSSYEHVLDIQRAYFSTLSEHAKGELLFGLAEGSARLGRPEKARIYFEQLVKEAPGSGQTVKANEWMRTGSIPSPQRTNCVGCHVAR